MVNQRNRNKYTIENLKRDLKIDIRAFLKKYAKNLAGHSKLGFVAFFITKGNKRSIKQNEIKNQWKKLESILGKYNSIYLTRAREYETLRPDEKKKSYYELTDFWLENIIHQEGLEKLIQVEKKIKKNQEDHIFPISLLRELKQHDNKIFVLASEVNLNWGNSCWNACGILMRIILERTLDKKHPDIKKKEGLKDKINFSLSNNIFSKSIKEAIKKLDHTTKITGDIVAHDSNILLSKNDIELAIVPLNILIKDVFKL
jgi:hypothetical protein